MRLHIAARKGLSPQLGQTAAPNTSSHNKFFIAAKWRKKVSEWAGEWEHEGLHVTPGWMLCFHQINHVYYSEFILRGRGVQHDVESQSSGNFAPISRMSFVLSFHRFLSLLILVRFGSETTHAASHHDDIQDTRGNIKSRWKMKPEMICLSRLADYLSDEEAAEWLFVMTVNMHFELPAALRLTRWRHSRSKSKPRPVAVNLR